jgi:hypothetical protein
MLALRVRDLGTIGCTVTGKLAACTYVEFVAAHRWIAKTGMNKRNLFCAWCHCSGALTTTVRRHTSRIRSTEVTIGAVLHVGWDTKRGTIVVLLVTGFQSTRSPCSLRSSTVSYWTGRRQSCERMSWGSSSDSIPEGGVWEILRARSGCN